jgi:hypothetical protein
VETVLITNSNSAIKTNIINKYLYRAKRARCSIPMGTIVIEGISNTSSLSSPILILKINMLYNLPKYIHLILKVLQGKSRPMVIIAISK